MTTLEFIEYLGSLGITLWLESDAVRCSAPKGALTSALRDELSKRKAEIRALLQQVKELAVARQEPIIPRGCRNCPIPLSFAQQQLWFLDQLEPCNPFYNIHGSVRFTGLLDVAALEQTLNEIIRRHEILRTTFTVIDGQPMQVISPAYPQCLPVVDLTEIPDAAREIEASSLVMEEARRPFELTKGPLLRFGLLRLNVDEYVMLLTMHHIISDGWSQKVLIREIMGLYTHFSEGKPSPLPALSVQYADFAIWQRQWLQGEVLKAQLSYWKQRLSGDLPVLELPTARPRPTVQSFRGAYQSLFLSKGLSEALKKLSRQEGVTLFMTLSAAFKTLMHRYTGQNDIVIGTDVANRNRVEIEGLIGCFVNQVVLRTDLSGNPSFQNLLDRVREVTLGAYVHQDLPFEKLVEELQPQRDLNRNPLYQVLFAFENTPETTIKLPALTLNQLLEVDNGTSKFDFSLNIHDTEHELKGFLEYNIDLFDADTMTRMLSHYKTILESIVACPAQKISDLSSLSASERHQLLVEWNDTQTDYPKNFCFHTLFEAQAELTPDTVAAIYGNEQLTYRELNQRANKFARILIEKGVGPDVIVTLIAKRDLSFLITMLAVFKAGGAYLPLNPIYPVERHAQVLKESRCTLILAENELIPILLQTFKKHPSEESTLVLQIEELLKQEQSQENLPISSCAPNNLAYVIYTSGSTGVPKGAMVTQGGMINHLYAKILALTLTEFDIVVQNASQCFDVSVWQFLAILLVGGRVYIVNDDIAYDPAELLEQLKCNGVSIFEVVPSMLRMIIKEASITETNHHYLSSIRWMISTGEVLPPGICREWFKKYKEIPLLNAYGPTECSDDVTHHLMTLPPIENAIYTPIGRPIANTQIHLLDTNMQPVPIGIPGELYVAGVGLGRGYLNRPDLTAEKFIPNPYSDTPGSRLYKTEDLARYQPDGNIEYLGRIDHQIKIRGYRIEPSEVESHLLREDGIKETVVVSLGESENRKLCAYIVCEKDISESSLRDNLAMQLPNYMIPTHFIRLEHLPKTHTGKIDRKLLPKPELLSKNEYIQPANETENNLVKLWAQILDVQQEKIGREDSFFDLGGHSLKVITLASEVHRRFDVKLPLAYVFKHPTVKGLADYIRGATQDKYIDIKPASKKRFYPLSTAQKGIYLSQHLDNKDVRYNLPVILLLEGEVDRCHLEDSFKKLIFRHEPLRTSFHLIEDRPVQEIHECVEFAFEYSELDEKLGAQNAAIWGAFQSFVRPFDLSKAPLLRVRLLKINEEKYILMVDMHHIFIDVVSQDILVKDLQLLYHGLELPPLRLQYKDVAEWQNLRFESGILKKQEEYWLNIFKDNIPVLNLPVDFLRPSVPSFDGARVTFMIEVELASKIKKLVRETETTTNIMLLATFAMLLSKYTLQEDIVIGTPMVGRQHVELENMLGIFVNMLAIRNYPIGTKSFAEFLESVKKNVFDAYDNVDYQYEELVNKLRLKREPGRNPLFDVVFSFQKSDAEKNEDNLHLFENLKATPHPLEYKFSKFDLQLRAIELVDSFDMILEYKTSLFKQSSIKQMTKHFKEILHQVVLNKEIKVNDIALSHDLLAAESSLLLVEADDFGF